jgi:dephospho-CoA kinase
MINHVVISGLIGSGKSTVISLFAELGVPALKTDDLAKTVRNAAYVQEWIMGPFANKYFANLTNPETHTVSLPALRALLFSNDDALKTYSEFMHPKVGALLRSGLQELGHYGKHKYALVEMPIVEHMHESTMDFISNSVCLVNVIAGECVTINRIQRRNPELSLSTIKSIIDSQRRSVDKFLMQHHCAVVTIDNMGDIDELNIQVGMVHRHILRTVK